MMPSKEFWQFWKISCTKVAEVPLARYFFGKIQFCNSRQLSRHCILFDSFCSIFIACKGIHQFEIVFSKSFLVICFRTLPLYVIYSLSISLFIENNAEVKCIFEKIFWSSPNCILYDSFLSIYFFFFHHPFDEKFMKNSKFSSEKSI